MVVGPRRLCLRHACLHRKQSLVVAHVASSPRVLFADLTPEEASPSLGLWSSRDYGRGSMRRRAGWQMGRLDTEHG